jgi:hypothetical protein
MVGPLAVLRVAGVDGAGQIKDLVRFGFVGPSGRGYLPGHWRLANVAYPLFLREGRVNDGGVGPG